MDFVRVGAKIQIGQFWVSIPLVREVLVYHVRFLFVMSLTRRWVRCKLAAVLASGMGASPFEGFV